MAYLRKVSRRKTKTNSSMFKEMDEHVKSDAAWKGRVSMQEGEVLLQGKAPFTYMLCEGIDNYHYFLFYVGTDQKVHYKNVRIHYVNGDSIFRNGGSIVFKRIKDLVPICLRCSSGICKPLV